jgi:polyhydroxybutyrate depolymerase
VSTRAILTLGGIAVVLSVAAVGVAAALHGNPASGASDAACAPLSPGTHRIIVEAGRAPVVVHIPPKLLTDAPLVLALPGAGQTARDFAAYTGYSRLADAERIAVAYATASGSRPLWNVTDRIPGHAQDVPYLRAVIPAAVKAACADPARVGVTGVSNGGGMSARMACDAADLVAAAAPVAGGYGALPDCHPSRPVPILEIHGTADRVVPYAGRGNPVRGDVASFLAQWRRLDGCTGVPREHGVADGVQELRSTRCAGGTQVVHDRVEEAEHGWPGAGDITGAEDFSSTRRTFDFLTSFRR